MGSMTPAGSRFRRYLREVRRRRVPQTTVVYLVVGFGVLEAGELAFPRLGLPDWTVTLVLALVLLGLPIVVFLSWTFDLTGRGIERTAAEGAETSGGEGEAPAPTPWGAVIAALALARADPEPAVAPFVARVRAELERLRGEG